MLPPPIDHNLTTQILKKFEISQAPPTLQFLETLVSAYVRTVPWESVSRVVRREAVAETDACPRFGAEFWQVHLAHGTGGTCFESNYAFSALLAGLGYTGYLTINNMRDNIGCHTAIVIKLAGQKWLVDAGIPLYLPLPIDPTQTSRRTSPLSNYTLVPQAKNVYQVERDPHPVPYIFTLHDTPIPLAQYRQATIADYGKRGLFLDNAIINKVVGDVPCRYNGNGDPRLISLFMDGIRTDYLIDGEVGAEVAEHFGVPANWVDHALTLTQQK